MNRWHLNCLNQNQKYSDSDSDSVENTQGWSLFQRDGAVALKPLSLKDWREKCRLRLYLQNAEENMRSRREDQKNAEEQKHVGICK